METLASIRITFADASNQAKKLDGCAEDLIRARRQLNDIVNTLRQGWSGTAAEKYYQKCALLEEKLNNTADDIGQIADVIRTSAQRYYDAEKKALEIIATKGSAE